MEMIGLGIVTYKRFDFLKQCLEAARDNEWGGADYVVVIEDGTDYTEEQRQWIFNTLAPVNGDYIWKENGGVATAKNTALRLLTDYDCEHLFLMEDDILIKDPAVCIDYIKWAEKFEVEHMNFALHGAMNIGKKSYHGRVTVYPQCVGAFSYYTNNCLEKVGLMDENFFNAWEHVEHTWRIAKEGLTTPFWKFADHPFSDQLLTEIEGSIDKSSIRPREDWNENIIKGKEYWIKKHGEWIM